MSELKKIFFFVDDEKVEIPLTHISKGVKCVWTDHPNYNIYTNCRKDTFWIFTIT